jgi:hypothetical protein
MARLQIPAPFQASLLLLVKVLNVRQKDRPYLINVFCYPGVLVIWTIALSQSYSF